VVCLCFVSLFRGGFCFVRVLPSSSFRSRRQNGWWWFSLRRSGLGFRLLFVLSLFRLFALFQFLLALFPASFILFLLAPFPARLFLFLLLMFMCRSSLFVVMLADPHRRRFVLGVCYCVLLCVFSYRVSFAI
jgi:hypothetical protein